MNSVELNQWIARQGDTCLLSFSRGKDSIAAWLELRRYFKRIIPFHLSAVPGLEFIEKSLQYYEKFFDCHIIRLPHPGLYRWLNNFTFQLPERCAVIEKADLPNFDFLDVSRIIKEDYGLPQTTWTASGVRAIDNPRRWCSVQKSGRKSDRRQTWMPIFDWRKSRVIDEIVAADVGLPVDYRIWGRSWDGLDYRFLAPLKEHFPADYDRVLELFPFADLEIMRREMVAVA